MKNIVILTSGRGSNMEAIVRACQAEGWLGCIAAVISNRPEAAGLKFATSYGVTTAVVDHRAFLDCDSFDVALTQVIDGFSPDLVILAGFMRILTAGFVTRYAGRMLSIHPSLLPCFPGLHTYEAALAMGVKVHDATVHFVTADLDHGPIVLQAIIGVRQSDTPNSLAGRLLTQEHTIYPRVVRWFVEGRLSIEDGVVRVSPDESQLVIGVNVQEAA